MLNLKSKGTCNYGNKENVVEYSVQYFPSDMYRSRLEVGSGT